MREITMNKPEPRPTTSEESCLDHKIEKLEARALDFFRKDGLNIAQWSRENGFNPSLVYQVLDGSRKCLRGQSFRIAKALGMK